MTPHLVIMAREPVMGAVKTRLARKVGSAEAMRFYRANLAATLRRLADPRWRLVLALSPDAAIHRRDWPRGVWRMPQGQGDLGERMQRVFDLLPRGPAIIVGSDIPGIEAGDIADAFRLLGGNDAVIGPAPDGGYWLIGLKRFPAVPRIFDGVRWSTRHARADTLRGLKGHRVASAAEREDVDGRKAFRRWRRGAG